MENSLESVYIAPPLESKLILDTGSTIATSFSGLNPIGEYKSIPVNGSISSGVRKYQNNHFFWNHDFFTFSYKNCGIGVLLSCYNKIENKMYTVIYPIFLPRVCLSLCQKAEETVSASVKYDLLKQIVFYLNLGWTCYGNFDKTGSFTAMPLPTYGTPQFYAQDGKGNFTTIGSEIVNRFMPVIGEGDNLQPPLVWDISSSNMQLCLRWNPLCEEIDYHKNTELGWSLISLRDFMTSSKWISYRDLGVKPVQFFLGNKSGYCKQMVNGPDTGWCGQGGYHLGFGVSSLFMKGRFDDGYTDEERMNIFARTNLPTISSTPISSSQDFFSFCNQYRLVTKPGGVLNGIRIASFLPSRFYLIESDALSRQSQRSIVSNNPVIRQSTISIFYNTIFSSNVWKDESKKSGNFSSDNSVNHFNPMFSIQSVDLIVKDEWGNIIQNFNNILYPQNEQGGFYNISQLSDIPSNSLFGLNCVVEGGGCQGGSVPILDYPGWLSSWVPNSDMTNWETIIGNKQWNCNWTPFLLYNPENRLFSIFPGNDSFIPQASIGCNIIHLGRLLGF